jgi:hypothetical protein
MCKHKECWSAVAVILVLAGCRSAPKAAIQPFDDKEAMRAEILKYVPVGTQPEKAKDVMEGSGFTCSLGQYQTSGLPYLYCVLHKTWKFPVSRVWHVDVQYDESGVTDVVVSTGLIGP